MIDSKLISNSFPLSLPKFSVPTSDAYYTLLETIFLVSNIPYI